MIYNKTKKKRISEGYCLCRSSFSKAVGMMFRLSPKPLVFEFKGERKVQLHMMFVFFPIDVVYLNSKKEVVEVKEAFKPFTVYNPKKKSAYVIELASGTIKDAKISVGDRISF